MLPKRRMNSLTPAQLARFWPKVATGGDDECWPFRSSRTQVYGQFQHLIASRVAYFLHYGVDPGDQFVCHTCDNPPCCNPAHLFLGDAMANKRDCVNKGRHARGEQLASRMHPARGDRSSRRLHPESYQNMPGRSNPGESNGRARLTAEQVTVIRQRLAEGVGLLALAAEYNVSRSTIAHIRYGRHWKHLL